MGEGGFNTFLWVGIMIAIVYFMMIRPENKRKKKAQEMRDSLKKGMIVTTIGGIIGKIVQVTQDTLIVETGEDRVRIEFAKWAISSVGTQTDEQSAEDKKNKKADAIEAPKEESEEKKD